MTMPFDPYGYSAPMAPQRVLLARPDYATAQEPLPLADAPLAAYGAPQGFSLAGPPVSEPGPLMSQAPPPEPAPLMTPAPPPPLLAKGDSMSQGAGGAGPGAAPEGGPPGGLSAGTPGKLVPMAQPGAGAGGRPMAPPGYDPQNPGRAMTPGEIETDNLRRALIEMELRKRASAGRWVPQQKLQTSEATQGQVGPDPELFGRYVDARGYRADLDKQNADMEAGLAQKQAEHMAEAQNIIVKHQLEAERVEAQGRERAAAIRDQIGAMNEKVQGEGYDNMRLWNNASEGKKAGFLLAAALSGIGQAMMGRAGEPNSAIKTLLDLSDRDAERQKVNIANNRQKLNDLQRLYKDTLEQTGSEKAAISAVKIAKLEALKTQVDTEAATKRASQTTTKRMLDKDGNVVEWSVPLAAERTKATIDERIAQEDMIMSREINGQVSRQYAIKQAGYQGGSAGPDMNKILKLQEARGKMERDALESGSKMSSEAGKADASRPRDKIVYVDGKPFAVDQRVSQTYIDKVQERVEMADEGIPTVDAIAVRSKEAGGLAGAIKKDPAIGIAASKLAGTLSQLGGAGVPSIYYENLINDAATPGPRQEAAIKEVKRQLSVGKLKQVQSVGGRPE